MSFSEKDSELVAQADNFRRTLEQDPARYRITADAVAAAAATVAAYVGAYAELSQARATGVWSQQMTRTMYACRRTMLAVLKPIYSSVQVSTQIADADKVALGVHVRPTRRVARLAPQIPPLLTVTNVNGSVVSLLIRDGQFPDRKARPRFVMGTTLMTYAGERPASDVSKFRFTAQTGRASIDIEFPPSLPVGSWVWIAASFFNKRKQNGPFCTPVGAMVGAGSNLASRVWAA